MAPARLPRCDAAETCARLKPNSSLFANPATARRLPAPGATLTLAPSIERIFAKYAGLGWIGKNTCILNENLGSWLFLGVMLTSLHSRPNSCRRSLRLLHALPRCLPHPRLPCPISTRRHAVHFLSHHREARADPRRSSRRNRPPGIRLRHLPGRLSLEPSGPNHDRAGLRRPANRSSILNWIGSRASSLDEFRAAFRGTPD